jgi:hypothetical protein
MLPSLFAAVLLASSDPGSSELEALKAEGCHTPPVQDTSSLARIAGRFATERGWSAEDYAFFKPVPECNEGSLHWYIAIMPLRHPGMHSVIVRDHDSAIQFIPEG